MAGEDRPKGTERNRHDQRPSSPVTMKRRSLKTMNSCL